MAFKILVVDDEEHLARIVKLTLERAGYEAVCAYDGSEALEIARRERPSLVILDLTLPVIDGCQVCSALKGDERTKSIPVIILSGRDLSAARTKPPAPADLFIEKPFNTRLLLARISELIRAAG